MDQISVSSNPYGEMLRAPAYLSTIQYETQAGVCVFSGVGTSGSR